MTEHLEQVTLKVWRGEEYLLFQNTENQFISLTKGFLSF